MYLLNNNIYTHRKLQLSQYNSYHLGYLLKILYILESSLLLVTQYNTTHCILFKLFKLGDYNVLKDFNEKFSLTEN